MLRDKQLMMQLETRKAKAKDLTRVLHQWRTKLANSNLEEEVRAKELESAVHDMMREYQSLKGKVRHQRMQTHRRCVPGHDDDATIGGEERPCLGNPGNPHRSPCAASQNPRDGARGAGGEGAHRGGGSAGGARPSTRGAHPVLGERV